MTVAHWAQSRAKCVAELPGRLAQAAIDAGEKATWTIPSYMARTNVSIGKARKLAGLAIENVVVNINHARLMVIGIMEDEEALFGNAA